MSTEIGMRRSNGTFINNGAMVRYAGFPDPLLRNHFGGILKEHLTRNSSLLGQREISDTNLHDDRRDINKECGYKATGELTVEHFQDLFDRLGPAKRVVSVWPDECWQVYPEIFETEDPEQVTPFEEAVSDLCKRLLPHGQSFQKPDMQTHPIWSALHSADVLSGIGHFGVILIGINDGKALEEAVDGVGEDGSYVMRERKDPVELSYLRPFSENTVSIATTENDPKNPRYGLPTSYRITMAECDENIRQAGSTSLQQQTHTVHWSRVVHIADTSMNDSILFGVPRMRPVYNHLLDCRKVYSGSGEMWWRGALPGWSFETHPQLGGDVNVDISSMRDEVEDLMNGLQRYMFSSGISAKSLAPQVSDPTAHIKIQLEAICIDIDIPMRIFLGSERGELSSGQDDVMWKNRVRGKRRKHCYPNIIAPTFDRLIGIGVLPEPVDGYTTRWPDEADLNPTQEDDRLTKRTQALATYVNGGVDVLIPPKHFLTRFVGLQDREVDELLDDSMDRLNEGGEESDPLIKDQMMQDEKEIEMMDRAMKQKAQQSGGNNG